MSDRAVRGRPSPRRSVRKLAVGIAVAALASALLAGGLELGARLLRDEPFVPGLPTGTPEDACAVHDPVRGWRNAPGVRTRVVAPRFSYSVSINSRGLRDRDHDFEPQPGVFRVVLLGDSVAWGWGVDDGLAFADIAERELGPGVEVINLSVPGYSTDQQLATLRGEGRAYRPDLVLLCFVLNDVLGNETREGYLSGKPRWVSDETADGGWRVEGRPVPLPESSNGPDLSFGQRLYANSALVQALRPADEERELQRAAQRVLPRRTEESRRRTFDAYRDGAARLAEQLVTPGATTRMLLGELARECDDLGVPLVAFSVPHHHDRYLYQIGPHRPEIPEGAAFRTDLSRRLAEAGAELGFATFAVDDAYLEHLDEAGSLHVGDGHPNEIAHRLIAERVTRILRPYVAARGEGAR